jgi:Tfp pilus assembly protein PilW
LRATARGEAGFTLLELLLGCLLGTLVIAAGVELLRVHVAVARRLQTQLASTGGAAWALSIAARDAEIAGGDPTRAGVDPLSAASRVRMIVNADRDASGAVDASSAERVTLAWSSTSGGRFVRWLGNQSVSIASQVESGGLRMRYRDAAGAEIPTSGTADLSAADRARVRCVALDLDVIETSPSFEARCGLRAAGALRMRLEER